MAYKYKYNDSDQFIETFTSDLKTLSYLACFEGRVKVFEAVNQIVRTWESRVCKFGVDEISEADYKSIRSGLIKLRRRIGSEKKDNLYWDYRALWEQWSELFVEV